MKRRSFLAVAGATLTVLTAGCSDVISDEQQQEYEFGIYNASQNSHTITVRVGDSLEGHFQEEVFEMDAETANENVPVEDTPSRIYLEIDSSEEMSFPWPASNSELGSIASKADVWYEPSLEQEILIQEA
ncbi:hypothetical protein [Halorubrum sp. Atlit-26R]|uniref:hypothetical protein n=1 Tax=Halorubrum sp. Atlit-26R TaxID=2282128 RepID=UPI0011C3830E|nr:hypothetical protein [Halorubrum sp. Atlit-26R]